MISSEVWNCCLGIIKLSIGIDTSAAIFGIMQFNETKELRFKIVGATKRSKPIGLDLFIRLRLMGISPSDRLLRKLSQVLSGPSRVSHSFGSMYEPRSARTWSDTACKNVPPAPFYCTNPAWGAKQNPLS